LFDMFFQGLSMAATPSVLSFMIIGTLVGVVVGFIPGLGGTFAISILLPMTFGMEPLAAIALLIGAHGIVNTGGAISSILFNTPGAPGDAATVLDGYPMAQQGQAGRALGAALTASAFGGIIGAIALAVFIPIIKPIVLSFGAPEFFILALWGVSLVVSVSSQNIIKGLIVGGVGILISTIGLDPSTGIVRFGFGQLYLWSGIALVPVVLGLFAVAEMIDLAISRGKIAKEGYVVKGGVLEGIKDAFRYWFLMIRCSVLGVLVGFIPGLGGEVSCWMAYGHAAQTSKEREKFGKGAVEGVIAPSCAAVSKEGGALLPTLSFVVPGSAGMAILLGAFMIYGFSPGPEMLKTSVNVIFMMAWIMVFSNLAGTGITLVFANQIAKLTKLKGSYLVPIIIILCSMGAFTIHNTLGDLVVMLVFGVVGYLMKVLDYPRAVLLLGFVLGHIVENNLNLSLRLYGIDFLMRPVTLTVLILIIITLLLPVLLKLRAVNRQTPYPPDGKGV